MIAPKQPPDSVFPKNYSPKISPLQAMFAQIKALEKQPKQSEHNSTSLPQEESKLEQQGFQEKQDLAYDSDGSEHSKRKMWGVTIDQEIEDVKMSIAQQKRSQDFMQESIKAADE